MRIGIITCNNALNYGARLQAYALYSYLRGLGHDAYVIDYKPGYVAGRPPLVYNPGRNLKEWVKLAVRLNQRRREMRKHDALETFSRTRTQLSGRYRSIDELRTDPPAADIYIAGSDQIWNTDLGNGKDPAYYLDFGSTGTRRISYAASFAIPAIPERYAADIRRRLARLDAITVREPSAAKIIEGMGLRATVVCDPAFLLPAEQWDKLAGPSPTDGKPYLLVYDFERSDEVRKTARRIARLRKLRIYSVSPVPEGYADRTFCDCGPESFVALVRDAACVVSNSLHGSIFSIIFGRDFYVVNRRDGLNIRMAELLRHHGLENRIVDSSAGDDALTARIPYPLTRLAGDIEASKKFLQCL